MGNALRSLCSQCCSVPPITTTTCRGGGGVQPFCHHDVSSSTVVGVSALDQHICQSEIISQDTEGLNKNLSSSKKAQPLADVLKFELHTLPVDPMAVENGDTVTVHVSASYERNEAQSHRNCTKANALHQLIKDAACRVILVNNEEILTREYRIRLRGIDAPKIGMPYWKKAKNELVEIVGGKCLRVLVFYGDSYGRLVGDVYCNDKFVQEFKFGF